MSDRWRDEDRYGRWDEGRGEDRYRGNDYARGFYGAPSRPRYGYEDRGRDYGRGGGHGGYGDYGGREDRYPESWRGSGGYGRSGERDWADRAGDEVASWFGDDDAERRRRNEREDRRQGRSWGASSDYGYGGERGSAYDRGGSGESGYGRGGYGGRDRDRDYGFGASAGYRGQGYGGYGYGYGGAGWSGREHSRDYGREEPRERGFFERAGDEIASWFGDEEAERRRRQDIGEGGWGGRHRGRGPKGYARSDDRIREDVSDRLTDDPHIDASDIEVSVSSGEVTLSGTVENRFAKRHAEDLAEAVSGVRHVQNNLRVRQSASGSWSGAGTTGTTGTAGATGTAGMSGTAGTSGIGAAGMTGRTGGTSGSTGTTYGGSGRA